MTVLFTADGRVALSIMGQTDKEQLVNEWLPIKFDGVANDQVMKKEELGINQDWRLLTNH